MTNYFEIDFLEAGKNASGDAIALRYQDSNEATYIHIVDGGYAEDGERLIDHVREYYGTDKIDHVVLTHPDGDHASGLRKVIEELEVGTLWMNRPWNHIDALIPLFNYEYTETGLTQRLKKDFPFTAELEKLAEENEIEIRDAFQGDQIGEFTILAPSSDRYIQLVVDSEKTPEPERRAAFEGNIFERTYRVLKNVIASWGEENLKGDTEGTSPENESSIVQYANLCDEKILLTGDAGVDTLEEAYQYALQIGVPLPGIDRLDVPHHGSRRNVSPEILDKWLGPKLASKPDSGHFTAIISANQNDKTHPRKAVIRALTHRGANVYQTDGATQTQKNAPARAWGSAMPLEYPSENED